MQSIYIGKIVAHCQAIEKEKSSGYLSACILVFFAIIECISRHAMYAELFRSGMDTRVALTGLIYRKVYNAQKKTKNQSHSSDKMIQA